MYFRAGITHLAGDILYTALEILEWVLSISGVHLVSCQVGWIKLIKSLLLALAWNEDDTLRGWTSSRALLGRSGSKALAKALDLLALILRVGFIPASPPENPPPKQIWFPLWHIDRHMLPTRSNEYGYLNLFGPPRDEDGQCYKDPGERRRIFRKIFGDKVAKGAAAARGEEGEVGRAAATVTKVLNEALKEENNGAESKIPM